MNSIFRDDSYTGWSKSKKPCVVLFFKKILKAPTSMFLTF